MDNAASADPLAVFAASVPEELPMNGTDARKAVESDFLTALALSMGNDAKVHPVPFVADDDGYLDFETDVEVPGLPDGTVVDFRLTVPADRSDHARSPYVSVVVIDEGGWEYASAFDDPVANPRAVVDAAVKSATERAKEQK